MKFRPLLLALSLLATITTCSEPPVGPFLPPPQIIASVEHINFAFTYQHTATYIDDHGQVWVVTYAEKDSVWKLLDTVQVFTPEVFGTLLTGADSTGISVAPSVCSWILTSSHRVTRGTWSECTNSGNDMGTSLTSVFVTVGADQAKRIKLEQWGDFTCSNDHPLAAELSDTILDYDLAHFDKK